MIDRLTREIAEQICALLDLDPKFTESIVMDARGVLVTTFRHNANGHVFLDGSGGPARDYAVVPGPGSPHTKEK